jgi:putative toxin-antitoxin system antitoxin component (TIGR02293 family)
MSRQVRKPDKAALKRPTNTKRQASKKALAVKVSKRSKNHEESSIIRWLGGSTLVECHIHSDFDIIKASMAGINKVSVDELARYIGVSKKSMAEDILNVSIKTLERKDLNDKLDTRISSHALEVARVMQHAFEVFEEEEKAKRWLNQENRALKGAKPVQLLNTLTGINLVNDTLTRIEEGVYS